MTTSQQAPSVLLMGPSGSGKTYSISTLLEAGLEVFFIGTEPHALETLLNVVGDKKLDVNKLHYRYIGPARPGFDDLLTAANLITMMDQQALANMKAGNRADAAWIELLKTCMDFRDDKDGKSYGKITDLSPTSVVVVDSLSGISSMAMDAVVGNKVTASPGEWGMAMKALDKFVLKCTSDLKCYFVLTAHIEKETDEQTGMTKTMASTLGKKLAPTLPRYFSEVVLADTITEGDKRTYLWSTNTANTVLKNRALPISSKLAPSFLPIVQAYQARLKLVEPVKLAG